MLLSWAVMISSTTALAASMRACKLSREEAAKAADESMKLRQINASVFFISCPFHSAALHGAGCRIVHIESSIGRSACLAPRLSGLPNQVYPGILPTFAARTSTDRLQHASRNAHPDSTALTNSRPEYPASMGGRTSCARIIAGGKAGKKRSSQVTCVQAAWELLFPRSALFLLISLWKNLCYVWSISLGIENIIISLYISTR